LIGTPAAGGMVAEVSWAAAEEPRSVSALAQKGDCMTNPPSSIRVKTNVVLDATIHLHMCDEFEAMLATSTARRPV